MALTMAELQAQLTVQQASLIKLSPFQLIGMDAKTGRLLSGIDHLKQSIAQIVTTRIGTRVMRRYFGSAVPDLVDSPANGETIMLIYAAVATALDEFEPRFKLTRIYYADDAVNLKNGSSVWNVEGDFLGEKISASVTV